MGAKVSPMCPEYAVTYLSGRTFTAGGLPTHSNAECRNARRQAGARQSLRLNQAAQKNGALKKFEDGGYRAGWIVSPGLAGAAQAVTRGMLRDQLKGI